MAAVSVWIVEYSCVDEYPESAILYGRHNRGTRRVPHCFGVVELDERVVLVDVGIGTTPYCIGMCENHAIARFQPLPETLGRLGLATEEVDAVVLTHAHFDHAGALGDVPNARVVVQARERAFVDGLADVPERLGWLRTAYDPDTPGELDRRARAGLLDVVDGEADLGPGLRVAPAFDTHTAGSQSVTVDTEHDGRYVFAGDVIYVWDNLEGSEGDGVFVPIGLAAGSQETGLRAMGGLVDAAGGERRRVLPVHDEQLWTQFPSHRFEDGLRVAEVTLAPGARSRLPS